MLTVYPNVGGPYQPEIEVNQKNDLGINVSDIAPYISELQYFTDRIEEGKKESICKLSEAVVSLKLVKKYYKKNDVILR